MRKFVALHQFGTGVVHREGIESAEPIGHRSLNRIDPPRGIVAELRLGQLLFLPQQQPGKYARDCNARSGEDKAKQQTTPPQAK